MIPIEIRSANTEDLKSIAHVWREAWLSTGLATPDDPDAQQLKARLLSADAKDWTLYVACDHTDVVGFIAFDVEKGWVRQLFVSPARQGHAIGSRLLALAKQTMPTGFWLRTDAKNRAARRFYERESMHLVSEAPHPDFGKMMAKYEWP